jgi:hypothetical protein
MKANELRIGNYYYGDVLFPSEYNVITANDLVELDSDPLDDYYQPLPLTEEWLIKFGFGDARITDRLYTRKKTDGFYGFYINKETMSYCTFDYEGTIDDIIKIEYVHQLQNLYFAVTNEELTMK